jgi:magnesium transporter
MIKIYRKTVKNRKAIVSSELTNLKGSFIYCINPSDKEVGYLSEKLNISKSLIKDALDPFEVPRLEEDGNVTYVISSFPIKENGKLVGVPFAVAVGTEFVAIISSRSLFFLESWFEEGNDFITTQKTKLVNLVFKKLMEEYNKQSTLINKEVHSISLTLNKILGKDIIKLVLFEESLNIIIGDLVPTDAILRKILSGQKLALYEEDKESIEDTALYTEQLIEVVKLNLMKISNLRNLYSTILTNNLNSTMKFLTAITVILTLPTIFAGIYGMNVTLPLGNHPSAFLFIILAILISIVVLVYLFIKNDWF